MDWASLREKFNGYDSWCFYVISSFINSWNIIEKWTKIYKNKQTNKQLHFFALFMILSSSLSCALLSFSFSTIFSYICLSLSHFFESLLSMMICWCQFEIKYQTNGNTLWLYFILTWDRLSLLWFFLYPLLYYVLVIFDLINKSNWLTIIINCIYLCSSLIYKNHRANPKHVLSSLAVLVFDIKLECSKEKEQVS